MEEVETAIDPEPVFSDWLVLLRVNGPFSGIRDEGIGVGVVSMSGAGIGRENESGGECWSQVHDEVEQCSSAKIVQVLSLFQEVYIHQLQLRR